MKNVIEKIDGLNLRVKVRALVFDQSWNTLLCRVHTLFGVEWVPPGGGVDKGESLEDALSREIEEETGIKEYNILGSCKEPTLEIWDRREKDLIGFPIDGQYIHEYAVQVDSIKPSVTPNDDAEIINTKWLELSEVKSHLHYKNQYEVFSRVLCELVKKDARGRTW